eukprot:3011057-Rhodomonas_salina.3
MATIRALSTAHRIAPYASAVPLFEYTFASWWGRGEREGEGERTRGREGGRKRERERVGGRERVLETSTTAYGTPQYYTL